MCNLTVSMVRLSKVPEREGLQIVSDFKDPSDSSSGRFVVQVEHKRSGPGHIPAGPECRYHHAPQRVMGTRKRCPPERGRFGSEAHTSKRLVLPLTASASIFPRSCVVVTHGRCRHGKIDAGR